MQRWRTRRDRAALNALTLRPISLELLAVVVIFVVAVTAIMTWRLYLIAKGNPTLQIDAIRTGLTAGAGTGGACALLLAFRRQRSTEIIAKQTALARDREQEQQEQAAEATERDAVERRITELYTKAADQLGSEHAAVRLAGLYALQRLAQNTEKQRQSIVNVLCAYLRMPFDPPPEEHPTVVGDEERTRYDRSRQERQVRLTAQRIVTLNLRRSSDDSNGGDQLTTCWPDIDLDLTDAYLEDFDLVNCQIRRARFTGARFSGDATFDGTQFDKRATFDGAQFNQNVTFTRTQFSKNATFTRTQFRENATFARTRFDRTAMFEGARFNENATFPLVHFSGDAIFRRARFGGDAIFRGARFYEDATFEATRFGKAATFEATHFIKAATFKGTQFGKAATFEDTQFTEDAAFPGAAFNEDAMFDRAHFNEDAMFDRAQFNKDAMFVGAEFKGKAVFEAAQFSGNIALDEARALPSSPELEQSWPSDWTTRVAGTGAGEEPEWLYLTRDGSDEKPGGAPRSRS
ncbi:MAG: pentapeptide repeat-containing protein [Pseudonocardiaceae bacterium]